MRTRKSIIIFSDKHDYSTLKVAEYLQYRGENVIRINPEDTVECNFHVAIANERKPAIQFSINGASITLNNTKSIWFRRGGFSFKKIDRTEMIREVDKLYPQINQYFKDEQHTLNSFIYSAFMESDIKVLGNPFVFNTNKLDVLRKAAFLGLDIPYTLITTDKSQVNKLINEKKLLVTKAIQDNFNPVLSEEGYGLLTETIDENLSSQLPSSFFPSLFQERLNKKYDIRIFYLDGTFYAVAILSQENKQTATDFRNYDPRNPNRKNIFTLPHKIKEQLTALLKQLSLNTASIDMVLTRDDKYVFIEINPVGQYDMVGKPMNFHLDKKIALWLATK